MPGWIYGVTSPKADQEGAIHAGHGLRLKTTEAPDQPAAVDRADLVEEDHRIGREPTLRGQARKALAEFK